MTSRKASFTATEFNEYKLIQLVSAARRHNAHAGAGTPNAPRGLSYARRYYARRYALTGSCCRIN